MNPAGPSCALAPVYDFSQGLAEVTRISHEHEVAKITFLTENGFLTDAEVENVAARGREAKERIGTLSEHNAAQSPDYGGEKLAAARADAVLGGVEAMRELVDDCLAGCE
jgi:hypothetical protein